MSPSDNLRLTDYALRYTGRMRKGWKWIDLTGQVFGTWTAISYVGKSGWLCRCECGTERVNQSKALRKGQHRTCAACGIRACTQLIDMVGQKFGRLTVVERAVLASGRAHWRCRCECGNEKAILGKHLRRGLIRSCGCLASDMTTIRNETQDGLTKAHRSTYRTWTSMLARCENHHGYAGRGIVVCDRWRASFADFLDDMGPRPAGHSIERVNNDGNYEPGNCRWATRHDQARNTRRNRYVDANGKRMIVTDWAKETGISAALVYDRMSRGWSEADAVTRPPRRITRTPKYEATRSRRLAA